MNNDSQQIWEAYRDPRIVARHSRLLLQQELQAIQTLQSLDSYEQTYDEIVRQFHKERVSEIRQQLGIL